MIIWFVLFFIVVIASFILALKSMGDYQERPLGMGLKYSLFLVQNPNMLTGDILKNIYDEALKSNTIISIEKLFKGEKTALVIFAPKELTDKFTGTLNLLELEDYSTREINNFKIWEIGVKNPVSIKLPALSAKEEFWWQIVLKPKIESRQCRDKNIFFQTIIRAVLISEDKTKEQETRNQLGNSILPQAHSSLDILKSYRQRILPLDYVQNLGDGALPLLNKEQIMALLV
ncbi:MAG: hypothetical protein Q7R43_00500 [Candidatus Daviesbacteria bacterium]|nr:hypothetical protein [Candidatus Daviesbacteria bacterium]